MSVIVETIKGTLKVRYLISLVFSNFSNKYIIQGNKANARISGLKTNLIEIAGGKKFKKINVSNMDLFENFKSFNNLYIPNIPNKNK